MKRKHRNAHKHTKIQKRKQQKTTRATRKKGNDKHKQTKTRKNTTVNNENNKHHKQTMNVALDRTLFSSIAHLLGRDWSSRDVCMVTRASRLSNITCDRCSS